ncbi:MAG: MerR family transcriptional regulator [Victivallales bacterium]
MGTEKRYSVIELAELLGVPRTTINDWLSKYSMYIDYSVQGKRRVYTDSSLAVLKEISGLRNSGMSSVDIEAELAKRHPVRAEPEPPEAAPSSSVPQKDGEKVSHSSPPAAQEPAAKKENEFHLIAQRQSEELGKVIGETFQNMALRMEELERLNRAQNSRTKVWMGATAFVMVLLLTGAYFSYKQVMLFSRANTELKQEAVNTNQQLQMLHRQSIELVAGTKGFRDNIALLEKQLKEQQETFEKNINSVKQNFEKVQQEHQSRLSAEREKNSALLKMKEAELALEKEKFAAERLKFLRDMERMSSDNENIVNELKKKIEEQKTDEKKTVPPSVPAEPEQTPGAVK